MVDRVDQWLWSSYLAMTSKTAKQNWLETDYILSTFHSNRKLAIQAYIRFVVAGKGAPSPLEGRQNQLIMGSDEFIETNLAKLDLPKDLCEYSKAERRRPAKPVEWYSASANNRNDGIVRAYKSGRYSMKEIGDCFGLGYSMVSKIIKNPRLKT